MREYEFTVASGGQQSRAVKGNFARVKSADAEINLRFENKDGRVIADLNLTAGMRCTLPEVFETIRVGNSSGSSVDAVVLVGFGDVDDAAVVGEVDVSVSGSIDSVADVSIATVTTAQIVAANVARREVMITNLAANTANFRIGDSGAGAANGIELQPGQTITLTTTAAVYGYNSHTGAQSVAVLEVNN